MTAALLFFLISGAVSFSNVQILKTDNDKIAHSHDVIVALDTLFSTIQDAETGQRGFLLTGNEKYLQPYEEALSSVDSELSLIATLTRNDPDQQANLGQLKPHVTAMISDVGLPGMNGRELAETARAHRLDLPILFITGYAENAAIRSGFLGANMSMVTKPFSLEELAARVSEMVASPS